MDYNNNDQNRGGNWSRNPGSGLAAASMFLGIAAIFTILTVYLPLIFGGLAVILAVLSKGYGKKLIMTAKVGIGCALGGVCLISVMMCSIVAMILTSSGDTLIQFGQQIDEQYEKQTGTALEDLFGESYEDIMREYSELLGK